MRYHSARHSDFSSTDRMTAADHVSPTKAKWEPAGRPDWAERLVASGWDVDPPQADADDREERGDPDRVVVTTCPDCRHQLRVPISLNRHEFGVDVLCNCVEAHEGRPQDLLGCGSGGRVRIYSDDLENVSRIEARPMRYAVGALIEWQRRAEQRELEALPAAQALAEKWVGGIGTILGLFSAVSLVTGPSDISQLSTAWKIAVVGLLAVSALSAGLAFWFCADAAWGGRRFRATEFGGQLRRETYRRLREVERRLRRGRRLVGVAAILSVVAVLLTWLVAEPDLPREPATAASPESRYREPIAAVLSGFTGPVLVFHDVPDEPARDSLCIDRYVHRPPDRPGGSWWTPCDDAKYFDGESEIRDRLALVTKYQSEPLNVRERAKIPEGTRTTYLVGEVGPKCEPEGDRPPCKDGPGYAGGARQYYFVDADLRRWITGRYCSEPGEPPPDWPRCKS